MHTTQNEVVIHLDEDVDETTLRELEEGIRHDRGIISVGHHPVHRHLMVVVYDSATGRASNVLHIFRERGLHAQLAGL
jgi:hypothetical protein